MPPLPAWLGAPPPAEIDWPLPAGGSAAADLLLRRGPFPEPLQRDSDRFQQRWAADYLSLLIRGDLRDLTRLTQLDRLESLVDVLPATIGSPVSYSGPGITSIQVVRRAGVARRAGSGLWVVSADRFLAQLH